MERATFSVSFFVKRTKKLKDGTLPIFVRITVNGQRAEFGLQESVNLNQWNSFQKRKAGNSSSSKYLNSLFDHVKIKLHSHKMTLEETGQEVTAKSLKNAYMGINENEITMSDKKSTPTVNEYRS